MQNPFPPSVKLKAIEDAQPLYDRPMIVFTLSPEDRMLLERAWHLSGRATAVIRSKARLVTRFRRGWRGGREATSWHC